MTRKQTDLGIPVGESDLLESVQEKVRACMQCGTCSGSCANSFGMDLTPRHLWRLAQLGETDEVFNSKTFYLCSACYYCTLRCPRGLKLTETMGALKRLAAAQGIKKHKQSSNFYDAFIKTVERYGRVREMEFINRYFFSLKDPFLPLGFTVLGLKLMRKGKIPFQLPILVPIRDEKGKVKYFEGRFDKLFRKVEELEARS
ncbi:MAG: 4Fe-4S dicluster domain-containing protein [Desulfobacteraceae bacterium]|nr:4Fe-4S dicluster domain-containing protein [Desulfobacteraceae bacterium]